ncbi:histidine-phosphotransfer domain HPT domain-containing protein [Dichomitus squalens LYAD-421 SS1]|uniref:Histidine-phosphotransfer domain HPT domain-containing protein n=2 Tax=Dichomitus squalens TaxID=114155 RepID=A0A4Q9MHW4_9APHY|nr:histidine-phosphotransfer domain HPT domain-containing protein [Dichomitus squalens LYAD-421 SS1]EJF61052.1 histidine-phosphotransfer domain HPT domain-containing protein [Dichomitus squalens LYAD-421 SS1]TBU27064.1 histidine-phosphotransfer domain HPT domain-containing protein [Dichomitus squalens]
MPTMSHTKTAVKESIKSTERDLSAARLRSPSPPTASDARAQSFSPTSPKPAAARLTSPPPESPSRVAVRERTPAPASVPFAIDPSVEPESDPEDDEAGAEPVIDLETFNQILDLDEDDTHDFSLGMAEAYFTQASTTFKDMDAAFEGKDLPKLSSLGHFLKGSSAALGVSAVQATCEDIQHYGALRDETNGTDLTEEAALAKIGPLLKRVKREYAIAERWLQNWYKEHVAPAEV